MSSELNDIERDLVKSLVDANRFLGCDHEWTDAKTYPSFVARFNGVVKRVPERTDRYCRKCAHSISSYGEECPVGDYEPDEIVDINFS